jgi:hypothetical protein
VLTLRRARRYTVSIRRVSPGGTVSRIHLRIWFNVQTKGDNLVITPLVTPRADLTLRLPPGETSGQSDGRSPSCLCIVGYSDHRCEYPSLVTWFPSNKQLTRLIEPNHAFFFSLCDQQDSDRTELFHTTSFARIKIYHQASSWPFNIKPAIGVMIGRRRRISLFSNTP